MSKQEEKKRADELHYFSRFAVLAGLLPECVEQLSPPHPDVVCVMNGQRFGYELTTLTDEGLQKAFFGREERDEGATSNFSNFKFGACDIATIIRRKSANIYTTPTIDLVIHETFLPVHDLWLCDEAVRDAVVMQAVRESHFQNVWLVDLVGNRCLRWAKV